MHPKISIIIPIYNSSNYLRKCLDSVLAQTLKEIEIICIDDGSTDDSYRILKEYAKDKRFIILKQENNGAGAARNKGLDIAKGKFVAFLDSDDYYIDNLVLEQLYYNAIKYNVLIAGGFRQHQRIDGNMVKHPLHRHFFTNNDKKVKLFNYIDVQYDYHYHNYIFSNMLINKNNLRFPTYKRFQDPPFFVKVMFLAKQFIVIPIEFYLFRESERCNALFNSNKTCDLMKGLNDNLEFSSKNSLAILHYVTIKRFLDEYFFTIADNLCDNSSDIIEILFKASSLLNPRLIDESEKLLQILDTKFLEAMEIHNFTILPKNLESYNTLSADDKVRLAFLARITRERIIFNNEKWHFIHKTEDLQNEILNLKKILDNKEGKMKKNIKLQNITFPSIKMSEHWQMFYSDTMLIFNHIDKSFIFPKKCDRCDFATYFNSFSYRKWKTYTNIENLNLQLVLNGKFNVTLTAFQEENGTIKKYFLDEQTVIATKDEPINLHFPESDKNYTIVAFELKALSKDCEIFSGYYYSDIEESLIRNVSISLVTTTFKKEQFIIPNIEMLKEEILNSDEAIANGFDVHVIDNGRTLNPQDYNCEHLTVHPNKNVGGAGGFARGMIETIKQKKAATHVLLMDDDVIIMPEALKRTYNLLSLIKDEYKDHFISGAMLRMEQMNEQHEDIGYIHNDGYYTPKKRVMYLHLLEDVIYNEEQLNNPQKAYAAWWYCCVPIENVRLDNLPLPVFVRGDDVEFSLRNKAAIISLNGICVWHMGFSQKFNGVMELYQVIRNSLMIQATSGICDSIDFMPRIKTLFYNEIYSFNYNGACLLLDAVEDFLKGPDFFAKNLGESIIKEKSKLNENLKSIENNFKDISVNLRKVYDNPPLTNRERFIYQLTDNGHRFIPSFLLKDEIVSIPYDWTICPKKQYLRKQVLSVNPVMKTANLRKMDKTAYKKLMKRYKKLIKQYDKNFDKITTEYRSKQKYLTSIDFWNKYLDI